jgi:DNA polymerase II large subunit
LISPGDAMDYFENLRKGLDEVYSIAQKARSSGFDPEQKVEIPIAKDVAARVEGLVGPRGIASVIREMEQGGLSRPEIAFNVAERIASGDIIQGDARTLIEQAIRTSVGILTEGVLVAPTEGIADVQINENPDGSKYVAVLFAGPIRSAGGTVAALSVALADHARRRAGISDFRPTETEISRYVEEVNVYENRCVHLQYKPPDEHVAHIVRNCPVCIDGDPTEEVEVSVHRDLERIKGNRIRGGVPLVVCEGIAAKAPKVMKFTKKFGLGWDWLSEVMKVRKKADKVEIKPDFSYLEGLVAGRPVFSYPMEKGGFRLRYGRSRTNGIMGRNAHPATMVMLDSFIANGTHVKVERPGKGAILTTCDSIEPPVVKMKDGSVRRVRTSTEAEEIREEVEKVLFLGDMLITYGDFFKSNHPMMPGGYCSEWWEREAEEKDVPPESFPKGAKEAFELSRKTGVPLHPDYTCNWNDISLPELKALASLLLRGEFRLDSGEIASMELPPDEGEAKAALEKLLVEHGVSSGMHISLGATEALSLLLSLGMLSGREISPCGQVSPELSTLENVCALSGITIRDKSPTYIGARMGRPEKAKERMMEGKPHVLFPSASPRDRSLTKRYKSLKARERERTINADIARFRCGGCGISTFYPRCHSCGENAKPERICQKCGEATPHKEHCGRPTLFYDRRPVPLVELYEKAKAKMGHPPAEVKGVKGLVSENKIPELLEKGFYRAKNGVYVFRDGTCRFDATDAPLTHFRISEIGQSVPGIKKLGYTHDYLGKPITSADQVVPLMCQDLVVSSHCMDYMSKVADFVDDLLVNVYGMQPFYKLGSPDDLLGHLVVGLSPHTSGGVLGRIIGFCEANVGYAHPYFHTAKRRNCFSGDTTIPVLENGFWKLAKIRDLVEGNLGDSPMHDDFGTAYSATSSLNTLAFNKSSRKFEVARITHVSRHRSMGKLVELETKSGRKALVTPDHPFPTPSGKKPAESAEEVYVPARIAVPPVSPAPFDLSDYGKDVFSSPDSDPLKGMQLKELSKKLGMNYKTLTNYIYRKSFPVSLLKKLGKDNPGWKIHAKRDSVSLNRIIRVDADFLFILGLYLAEGHMRISRKNSYHVSFAVEDAGLRKLLVEKITRVFGAKPSISPRSVTICSRLVCSFFGRLGLGKGARSKRVPPFVLSLPDGDIAPFLMGYFMGDGSSSLASTLEVNCTSVSRELLEEISFLLSRLGMAHSWSESEREIKSGPVREFYAHPIRLHSYKLRLYGDSASDFIRRVGFASGKKEKSIREMRKWETRKRASRRKMDGEVFSDKVSGRRLVGSKGKYTYSLTVSPHHSVISSGIVSYQCDGDEDCLILLADCLINFSRSYLSNRRGGTMDAPLTLTPQINPSEVDDEVHCMEVVEKYPLEFYRACERNVYPGEIKLRTVQDLLGKEEEYGDLHFTHDTATLNDGPMRTRYVTLGSIPEKIEAEFALHKLLRPVDVKDAAQRLILSHFIPDLYGNLRSYSRQTFRCVSCNTIFRRPPLSGKCARCGGKLTLTIHKGGIMKYLDISKRMVSDYSLPNYLAQRLELLEQEIASIFEDEKMKQTGLSDFM